MFFGLSSTLGSPGETGEQVNGGYGEGGGAVFLKSAFLVFLVIFLQTLAKVDARNLSKNFLTPRGARGGASKRGGGHKGDSFLKICSLGIFGDIASNLTFNV